MKNLSTSSKSTVGNQVRKILNVLKSHWNPQRHHVLNRFTRSHQKFLKDFFNVLRASGPQIFQNSSKGPESPQKVMKMHKRYRQGPQVFRFSTDPQKCPQIPQKVIKALEVLRSPQKVIKATSIPQNVINVLKILWSSKVPQMVIKWSSQSPQKFLKNSPQMFHKKSSKSSWKVLQCFEILMSTGLQKVLKRSTKSSKSQENAQKVPKVLRSQGSQLILKMSSNSSKGHQSPRSPQRFHKRYSRRPQFLKTLSTSSKSCGRQKFLKWSSNGPHRGPSNVPKNRPQMFRQEVIKSSWKILQCFEILMSTGLQKVRKMSTKSSKSQENAQKVPKVLRSQVLNWSTKCPQIPQMVIKALEVPIVPQKVFKAISKSSKIYQRPQSPQ